MIALNTGKHKPIIFQMFRFQEVKILIPEKYGQYEELAVSQLMEKHFILPFPRTVTNLSCSFFFFLQRKHSSEKTNTEFCSKQIQSFHIRHPFILQNLFL